MKLKVVFALLSLIIIVKSAFWAAAVQPFILSLGAIFATIDHHLLDLETFKWSNYLPRLAGKNETLNIPPDEPNVPIELLEKYENFDVDAPRTDPTPEEIARHKEYDRKLKEEYQQRIKNVDEREEKVYREFMKEIKEREER